MYKIIPPKRYFGILKKQILSLRCYGFETTEAIHIFAVRLFSPFKSVVHKIDFVAALKDNKKFSCEKRLTDSAAAERISCRFSLSYFSRI